MYLGEQLVILGTFCDIWMRCTHVYTSDWSGSCSEEGPLVEDAPSHLLCETLPSDEKRKLLRNQGKPMKEGVGSPQVSTFFLIIFSELLVFWPFFIKGLQPLIKHFIRFSTCFGVFSFNFFGKTPPEVRPRKRAASADRSIGSS